MSLDTRNLRRAINAALRASSEVHALVGNRVHNDRPKDEVFPYITLGGEEESDWSTSTEQGSEFRVQISCWSRKDGQGEADDILSAVHDALHDQTLAIAGTSCVLVWHVSSVSVPDADGLTWHGVGTYRVLTDRG